MADQHHGIPMSFSPNIDDISTGQQLQQQYASAPVPYVGDASGFYFQQQYAPYAAAATFPNLQEAGSSSTKKVRGRPPGSRNKPKPPVIVTQDIDYPVKPAVIDIGSGFDVVEATVLVARRRNAGIAVLHAAGAVNNVRLCHPLTQAAPFTVHGPFNLLGFSGSYLTPSAISGGFPPPSLPPFIPNLPPSAIRSSFGITLTNPQGYVFGGTVAGKVVAADQGVTVTALLFKNPEYHNIGVLEYDIVEEDIDNEDGGDGDHAGVGGSGGGGAAVASGSTMPVFGSATMGSSVPVSGSGGGGGLGASGFSMPVFGSAPTPISMGFSPVSMGSGFPIGGSSGGGLGASGSSMPVFGSAPTPISMGFSPVSMGSGFPIGGSSGGGPGASGSSMPAFGLGLAPTSIPMGFSVPASGSGGGGLGASSSSMPAFSLGLAPTLAPMDYGVPSPNVMHWGHGQPGAHSPYY